MILIFHLGEVTLPCPFPVTRMDTDRLLWFLRALTMVPMNPNQTATYTKKSQG